ncbi:MAG TPA: hypothetical protein ENN66_00680 [Proteobacteria bacterium]|nr:hypothetical protein [Pseudomonadota bacterium]
MKTWLRLLFYCGLVLVLLLLAVAAGLKLYFTEERLRSLLLPPIEDGLGRKVEVASLQIDLFKGVRIGGLAVKEGDGRSDFVTVREFSLGYNWRPLLQRRLEISRVRVAGLALKVRRRLDGSYNYSELKFLQSPTSGPEQGFPVSTSSSQGKALPLALVVQRVEIENLRAFFFDEKGELPAAELVAALGADLKLRDLRPEALDFSGKMDFNLTAEQGSLQAGVQGQLEFDRQRIDYHLDNRLNEQAFAVSGRLSNYLGSRPELVLDLAAGRLDLAYLFGLVQPPAEAGGLPKPEPRAVDEEKAEPLAEPPLTVRGRLAVAELVYENYRMRELSGRYQLANGVFELADFKGKPAEGLFSADLVVRPFQLEPEFDGNLSFSELQIKSLSTMMAPALAEKVGGAAFGRFSFSGRGFDATALKRHLSLEGNYGLQDGYLRDLPLTASLAQLLGAPEFESLKIDDLDGNLRLRDGRLEINGSWRGEQLGGRLEGRVGLDGSLDLPLSLVVNPVLSERMTQRYPWVRQTFNERGEAVVSLRLGGELSHPRLSLDEKAAQKQLRRKLEKQLVDTLKEKFSKKIKAR